jgi:hypothetical protein
MKKRYFKHFPKKEDYSKLFNDNDKGKLMYKYNPQFRDFVDNWDKGNPNLLGWTFGDFYNAFMTKEPRLF